MMIVLRSHYITYFFKDSFAIKLCENRIKYFIIYVTFFSTISKRTNLLYEIMTIKGVFADIFRYDPLK